MLPAIMRLGGQAGRGRVLFARRNRGGVYSLSNIPLRKGRLATMPSPLPSVLGPADSGRLFADAGITRSVVLDPSSRIDIPDCSNPPAGIPPEVAARAPRLPSLCAFPIPGDVPLPATTPFGWKEPRDPETAPAPTGFPMVSILPPEGVRRFLYPAAFPDFPLQSWDAGFLDCPKAADADGQVDWPAPAPFDARTLSREPDLIVHGFYRYEWADLLSRAKAIETPDGGTRLALDPAPSYGFCDINRCRVDFATDGNDDPGKGMIAHNCQGGGWDTHAVYTNFTGTFAPPPGLEFQISSKLRSPRAILEMRGGALKPADHLIKANLRGISGTGWTDFNGKWKALLWLGEVGEDDLESFNSKEGRIVVGNGGSICPGYVDYDGGRRGKFSISYTPPQGTLPKLDTLEFRPGSKLSVTVRRDGTCSWIDASAVASDGGSLQVVLNGMLEVESPTPVRSKDATVWTVLKSAKPTTGAFTSIQEGYKVTYNVALAHGAYAVQVTKPAVGTIICLR